jgi:hypothetical protein
MTVANALAYCDGELMTAVKSVIVLAAERQKDKWNKSALMADIYA